MKNNNYIVSKLVEIDASIFEDDKHFLKKNCRASAEDGSMFIMDGVNFPEKIESAINEGCSKGFVDKYTYAVKELKADLVMFYRDV